MKLSSRKTWMMVAAPVLAASVGIAAGSRTAGAADATADTAALNERCATRLSISFLGKSPSADLLASADPKTAVDQMLSNPDFIERFARFTNSQFNEQPGESTAEDASYHFASYVLRNGKPWSDMFLGTYGVNVNDGNVTISDNTNGLGYFRTNAWRDRYAGNEEAGLKLQAAYRIMNNVVGLHLVASTNAPDADVSATGRQAGGCKGCHYDSWYALDHVANILERVNRNPDNGDITGYTAYTGGAQNILGGKQIANDRDLVQALVDSENYGFNACRLAFKFLYGRTENKCEGPVLDRCMDSFKAQGTIQSALASIAKEPGFCQ